jgi:hypothetical protein
VVVVVVLVASADVVVIVPQIVKGPQLLLEYLLHVQVP